MNAIKGGKIGQYRYEIKSITDNGFQTPIWQYDIYLSDKHIVGVGGFKSNSGCARSAKKRIQSIIKGVRS